MDHTKLSHLNLSDLAQAAGNEMQQRDELMELAREYRHEEPTNTKAVRMCVELARFRNRRALAIRRLGR